jgi:hypothetical protein
MGRAIFIATAEALLSERRDRMARRTRANSRVPARLGAGTLIASAHVLMDGALADRRSIAGVSGPRRLRLPRWLLVVLLVLVALVVVVAALASTLLYTDWGRDRVRVAVERSLNSSMMGELRVERIQRIDLPWVYASRVQIVAPHGVPAIDVHDVRIELDLGALLDGRMVWKRTEIGRGIVRVTEDAQGRVNMEETFKARKKSGSDEAGDKEPSEEGALDMQSMVTNGMTLVIGGGSLPDLRMENIHGIMRITTHADDSVTLRFDDYRGNFVKGLPTGRLDFEDVSGQVLTEKKRLLRFEGRGKSEGEPVEFTLDIHTEPKTLVEIDAAFPRLSAESLATLGFAAYSKFVKGLDLDVKPGRLRRRR